MTVKVVGIVDYGAGNIRSVEMALRALEVETVLVSSPNQGTKKLDGLILPGVGSFPNGMRRLRSSGLGTAVVDLASNGMPVLGICLGMQLLFEGSTELGGAQGLGLISGSVERLDSLSASTLSPEVQRLPNIGWRSTFTAGERSNMLSNCERYYFVHSYAVSVDNPATRLASNFGEVQFAASVNHENIHGVQFHPEKSGKAGLRLISDLLRLV